MDINDEVNRIVAGLFKIPKEQRLSYLKAEIAALPNGFRDAIETLLVAHGELLTETSDEPPASWSYALAGGIGLLFIALVFFAGYLILGGYPDSRQISVFLFAAFLLVVSVVVSLVEKKPTGTLMLTIRVVLAVAAACVGALLPGYFEIENKWADGSLRIGGAAAFFYVVFRVNPATRKFRH